MVGKRILQSQNDIFEMQLSIRDKKNGTKLTQKKSKVLGKLYKNRKHLITSFNENIKNWKQLDSNLKYDFIREDDVFKGKFELLFYQLTESDILRKPEIIMIKLLNVIDRSLEEMHFSYNDICTVVKKSKKLIVTVKNDIGIIVI